MRPVSRAPPRWLDNVQSKDSAWVPDSAIVAASKQTGHGLTSFEDLYEVFYSANTVDMLEFAMWWTGVEGDLSTNYGAFGADGIFMPREDLGGVVALKAGVDKIHRMGRRIQLYVSADIVNVNGDPPFFNSSWPWQKWADWPTPAGPSDPKKNYNASTLCHAFAAWQQQIAKFASRVIALTGVDGVRLDGLGGQYQPCDNKDHHHTSRYENQGSAANVQIARLTRQAMDSVPNGTGAILSSEGYSDVFFPDTTMALIMWGPGRGIDAMRVAMPENRGAAYSPDAGAIETGLNGWMASASDRALRMVWPYGSKWFAAASPLTASRSVAPLTHHRCLQWRRSTIRLPGPPLQLPSRRRTHHTLVGAAVDLVGGHPARTAQHGRPSGPCGSGDCVPALHWADILAAASCAVERLYAYRCDDNLSAG